MTGEITLRGLILPVGGIKEKVLAAHRSGLKTVILPVRNEADLEDLPDEVRQGMSFVFAECVDDVLKASLESFPKKQRRKGRKTTKAEDGGTDHAESGIN
jgi:ATP-dependent Lon protease